jgi:Flp pilus assembly protein TadG
MMTHHLPKLRKEESLSAELKPNRYLTQKFSYKASRGRSSRRRGVAAILVAFGLIGILGAAALSFDLSYLYNRKAEAQKAADAAALAGAVGGVGKAERLAALNGYDINNPDPNKRARVWAGPDPENNSFFKVTVNRPERVYFASIFTGPYRNVGATASAEFLSAANVPLQNYGVEDGPISISVFGRYALHEWGDPFSVMYLTDGSTNPEYTGKGYDFNITPTDGIEAYKTRYNTDTLTVEIFDPGTGNVGGLPSSQAGVAIDELQYGHNPDGTGRSTQSQTNTKYSLYYDNGTPSDTSDDLLIDSKTYGNTGPDMAWDPAFTVQLDSRFNRPNGQFRVNVTTLDGTSENGFNLRAGPPHGTMSSEQWKTQFGNAAGMSARGAIPINFNSSGDVQIDLGVVPPLSRGGEVTIEKFDLDVGSESVSYFDAGANVTRQGTLIAGGGSERNDRWAPVDRFTLPAGYTGGKWTANYRAGLGDTSVWRMRYTGNGVLQLVR